MCWFQHSISMQHRAHLVTYFLPFDLKCTFIAQFNLFAMCNCLNKLPSEWLDKSHSRYSTIVKLGSNVLYYFYISIVPIFTYIWF